jgi:hypothetical protein
LPTWPNANTPAKLRHRLNSRTRIGIGLGPFGVLSYKAIKLKMQTKRKT